MNAIALLCVAQFLVAFVPFDRWCKRLGFAGVLSDEGFGEARRLVANLNRAAILLRFRPKCLPQAMALSWMLKRQRIAHAVVIAVRPPALRVGADTLHAWVEVGGARILGDLPGRWLETLRLEG